MKYLSTGNAVYDLNFHLVIVTKYRRKVLTKEMIEDCKSLSSNIIDKNKGHLIELNGEEDHIHLLFEVPPTVFIPRLINSIKTVTSRVIRKKYSLESLKKGKSVLWSPSYFISSCGNVKLEILKRYVENQGNVSTPPKTSLGGA